VKGGEGAPNSILIDKFPMGSFSLKRREKKGGEQIKWRGEIKKTQGGADQGTYRGVSGPKQKKGF